MRGEGSVEAPDRSLSTVAQAKGYRRYLDCLSPRWTFVQKFSLNQIRGTIFTAV